MGCHGSGWWAGPWWTVDRGLWDIDRAGSTAADGERMYERVAVVYMSVFLGGTMEDGGWRCRGKCMVAGVGGRVQAYAGSCVAGRVACRLAVQSF